MIITVGRAQQPLGLIHVRKPGFPHWILSLLNSGRSFLHTADGTVVQVEAGDSVLVRPRTPYRLEMPDGGRETWAIFDPPVNWEELLVWPEAATGITVLRGNVPHAASARSAFLEAESWWMGGSPRRAAMTMNTIERCLLLHVLDRPGEAWSELHPGIRQALGYLAPGPADRVSVSSLARRVGLSPSYFAHTFVREVGETPLSWLEGRRIARAQHLLLSTDQPVKRIAQTCGFANGDHLSRRFRARTGQSPLAWRTAPAERPSPPEPGRALPGAGSQRDRSTETPA